MTPEERADKIINPTLEDGWSTRSMHWEIAHAIREAVAAETERCARVAERREFQNEITAPAQIAAAIRAQTSPQHPSST